jgi:hypothetical protein
MRTNVPEYYGDPEVPTTLHASGVSKVDGKLKRLSRVLNDSEYDTIVIDGTDLKLTLRDEGDAAFNAVSLDAWDGGGGVDDEMPLHTDDDPDTFGEINDDA